MPSYKKKNATYKPRFKPRRKNKYKKVNVSKLMDKKINTAIERRAVQIARKEAAAVRVNLIKRNYLFAAYDKQENLWTPMVGANGNPLYRVDFGGLQYKLTQNIYKADNSAVPVANIGVPADVPETDVNESLQPNYGPNLVSNMESLHGRRTQDTIKCTGCKVNLRFTLDEQPDINNSYSEVVLRAALVMVRRTDPLINPWVDPSSRSLLIWNPVGFSKALDDQIDNINVTYKKKTLKEFTIKFTHNSLKSRERTKILNYRFKKPLDLRFDASEAYGAPENYNIYLVLRSNIPPSADEDQKPIVMACSKLFYYEP